MTQAAKLNEEGEFDAPQSEREMRGFDAPQPEREMRGSPDAVKYFMEGFRNLCRSEEEFLGLEGLAKVICNRWGTQGCDLIVAFRDRFRGLDYDRFRLAVRVFVHGGQESIQNALEQFQWLMGMGGHEELLADKRRFEAFCMLMMEQGIETCSKRAAVIRKKINAVTGEKR